MDIKWMSDPFCQSNSRWIDLMVVLDWLIILTSMVIVGAQKVAHTIGNWDFIIHEMKTMFSVPNSFINTLIFCYYCSYYRRRSVCHIVIQKYFYCIFIYSEVSWWSSFIFFWMCFWVAHILIEGEGEGLFNST